MGETNQQLVTIILTTFNSERYVARSIASCLNQTHRNIELLVVDGGSTDRTLEVLCSYDDARISVIHQPGNSGKLPGALNLGMASARGDFITWTQDDSWYEPNAIQVMLDFLDRDSETALVYTDYWLVNEEGEIILYHTVDAPELRHFLVSDVIGQSFLFRRKIYEVIGPQQIIHFPVHEIPWRVRVYQQFRIKPLHHPLVYYTLHDESLTGRIGGWELQRMMTRSLLSEHVIDENFCRVRLAEIDMDESYEAFVRYGDYGRFWRLGLRSAVSDWRRLRNRGYTKLMLVSLLPGRNRRQAKLRAAWEAEQDSYLKEKLTQYQPSGFKVS